MTVPSAIGMFAAELLVPGEEVTHAAGVGVVKSPAGSESTPDPAVQSVHDRIAASLLVAARTVRGWSE